MNLPMLHINSFQNLHVISFLELVLKDFKNDMEITTKGAVKV